MKIVFISYDLYLKEIFEYHFKPLGFEIKHHKDPVEIIESLDQFDAEAIIYYERDYPRHWKPLLKMLRERKSKKDTVFILITYKEFPFEEAAKAIYLQSNAIIVDNIYNNRVIYKIEEVLRRYFPQLPDTRKTKRIPVEESDRINFVFTHPELRILITGRVLDISYSGLRFFPKAPQRTINLKPGQIIPLCSLLLGDTFFSVNCEIVLNNQFIGFRFNYFKDTQTADNPKIKDYLFQDRLLQRIDYHIKKNGF